MVKNKESFTERYTRRLARNHYKRSENVQLYPVALFSVSETLLLPVPVYTSNREYLTSGPARRVVSLLARVVQVALYGLLSYIAVYIVKYGFENPQLGTILLAVLAVLCVSFFTFQIIASISYAVWLLRHFRTKWEDLR